MKIITEYSNTMQVDVIEIKTAVYTRGFTIEIHFNDGKIQIVDFEPFLNCAIHPSIRQYLNEAKFK